MGIEPTLEAWEAPVLPLNYARKKSQRRSLSERPAKLGATHALKPRLSIGSAIGIQICIAKPDCRSARADRQDAITSAPNKPTPDHTKADSAVQRVHTFDQVAMLLDNLMALDLHGGGQQAVVD